MCVPFLSILNKKQKKSQVNQLEIPRRVFDDRFTLKRCGARCSSSSCHREELAQLKKIIGPNLIILSTRRDVKNQETKPWRQSCSQISGLQGAPALPMKEGNFRPIPLGFCHSGQFYIFFGKESIPPCYCEIPY